MSTEAENLATLYQNVVTRIAKFCDEEIKDALKVNHYLIPSELIEMGEKLKAHFVLPFSMLTGIADEAYLLPWTNYLNGQIQDVVENIKEENCLELEQISQFINSSVKKHVKYYNVDMDFQNMSDKPIETVRAKHIQVLNNVSERFCSSILSTLATEPTSGHKHVLRHYINKMWKSHERRLKQPVEEVDAFNGAPAQPELISLEAKLNTNKVKQVVYQECGNTLGILVSRTHLLCGLLEDKLKLFPNDYNEVKTTFAVNVVDNELQYGPNAAKFSDSIHLGCELESIRSEKPYDIQLKGNNHSLKLDFLIGYIFARLRWCAENVDNQSFTSCILCVPSYYSNGQRIQIKNGALIAGFTNIKLVNDTTAAAFKYLKIDLEETNKPFCLIKEANEKIYTAIYLPNGTQNLEMVESNTEPKKNPLGFPKKTKIENKNEAASEKIQALVQKYKQMYKPEKVDQVQSQGFTVPMYFVHESSGYDRVFKNMGQFGDIVLDNNEVCLRGALILSQTNAPVAIEERPYNPTFVQSLKLLVKSEPSFDIRVFVKNPVNIYLSRNISVYQIINKTVQQTVGELQIFDKNLEKEGNFSQLQLVFNYSYDGIVNLAQVIAIGKKAKKELKESDFLWEAKYVLTQKKLLKVQQLLQSFTDTSGVPATKLI